MKRNAHISADPPGAPKSLRLTQGHFDYADQYADLRGSLRTYYLDLKKEIISSVNFRLAEGTDSCLIWTHH